MSRSIDLIRKGLIDSLTAAAAAVGLTIIPSNWSRTDYKLLTLDVFAASQGFEEQLWDAYRADIDARVALAAPETGLWWQNQLLNIFQFNSSNPQVVQIISPNYNIAYPTPNDSYKIIKYCAVVFITYGRIQIKVAAQVGGVPADIDTTYGAGTLDTVKSFVNTISDATIVKFVQSGLADKIMIGAKIYYDGTYAAVIKQNVKNAINTYFKTKSDLNPTGIPFNGLFDLTDLARVIKNVEGVKSFIFNDINARADSVSFSVGSYNMVQANTELTNQYQLVAGYCVTETTTGYTIDDTLTYIPS